MRTTLLAAVRIVERADTNSMRTVMFARYASQHAAVRLILAVYRLLRSTPLGTAMVALYGAAGFVSLGVPREPAELLALARFANARRQLGAFVSSLHAGNVAWVGCSSGPSAWFRHLGALIAELRRPRAFLRYRRLVRRFCRRHDFYVACRLASTVALYARSLQLLSAARPKGVLVSSDYNTEEVAMMRAAKRLGIATIYVAHAHTNRLSPPLDADLAVLDGEAALDVYRERGPVTSRVVLRGVDGPSAPMAVERLRAPAPVIGLFLPSQIHWDVLRDIVTSCRLRFSPARFRVRWHPNMVEPERLDQITATRGDIDVSPPGTPLVEDARTCDWVIADESSNVHLAVLKTGISTIAIAGLGVHPADMADHYGFVRHGVIPPLLGSVEAVQMAEIEAFYGPGWADRFRYYDAGYMRPQEEIDHDVRRAIGEVTGRPRAAAH